MASKYFLFPSYALPDINYILSVISKGFRFVHVCPSDTSLVRTISYNGVSLLQIYIHSPSNIDFQSLVTLYDAFSSNNILFLRTYLEIGAPHVFNYPEYVHNYVVLGDSHHLLGCFSFCYTYLTDNNICFLSSYANPSDSLLLAQLCNIPIDSCFVYPPSLVVRNTLGSFSSGVCDFSCSSARFGIGLCTSLSVHQHPRSSLLRSLLLSDSDSNILSLLRPHDFYSQADFSNFLHSVSSYVVPSNGGQISPSLISAYSSGCAVVSNCFNQLTLHDEYKVLLSLFFPLDILAPQSLFGYSSFCASLSNPIGSILNRFKFISSEIDFFLSQDKYFMLTLLESHPLFVDSLSFDPAFSFQYIDKLIAYSKSLRLFSPEYFYFRDQPFPNSSPLVSGFHWAHFS